MRLWCRMVLLSFFNLILLFHDGVPYHKETSPMDCFLNDRDFHHYTLITNNNQCYTLQGCEELLKILIQ